MSMLNRVYSNKFFICLFLSLSLYLSVSLSMYQEERRQLSSMLGFEAHSMLCVPVVSQATTQVVALACAFNKKGGQK